MEIAKGWSINGNLDGGLGRLRNRLPNVFNLHTLGQERIMRIQAYGHHNHPRLGFSLPLEPQ